MCDHDDQSVFGYLLQNGHYLGAGLGIESARRLIGQYDVRVVYESTGYRHTLYLTARHLCRFFVYLIAQSDLLKRLNGAGLSFCG